jgi:hypothetical protein
VTPSRNEVRLTLSGSGELPSVAALERAIGGSYGRPVTVTIELFASRVVTSDSQASVGQEQPGPVTSTEPPTR